MASFPQEIGRNSLQKSYAELHDEPTAELLDHGMISGSDKDMKELPDRQEQAFYELDTGTMQYSELPDVPTAELPSQDIMSSFGKKTKKFSIGSTHILRKLDSTSDSSASTAASGPQTMHTNRFTFLLIREKIAKTDLIGPPISSAKRRSGTPLLKPRPALAVAASNSWPLLPVFKYNTRSKSSSPPRDHV